jgi:hypothetical protein
VYYLARPREGGISAPASIEEMDAAAIASYIAMLQTAGESEHVFASLGGTVRAIVKAIAQRPPGAPMPDVQDRLAGQCGAAADALLQTSMFEDEPPASQAVIRRQLLQVLESWTMEQIHAPAIAALRSMLREETAVLGRVLDAMRGLSQDDVGVKPRFQADLSAPLAVLARLPAQKTPLAKLHLLRDVTAAIRHAIELRLRGERVDISDIDFSTDDTLDVLLYLLLQGHPSAAVAELPVQLDFVERFHFASVGGLHRSTLGYHVANFHQAVGYFLRRAGELGITAGSPTE